MSVANGELANQDTFNGAFVSREINTDTVGKFDLKNVSSSNIIDTQRELNAIARYTGKTTNTAVTTAPSWASNEIGASSDSLFNRIQNIQTNVTTTLSGKNIGGVIFGKYEQDTTRFFYDSASGFLGVGTNSPSANFEVNGSFALRSASAAIAGSAIANSSNSFIRITSTDATSLNTIPAPVKNADQVKIIANVTGGDVTVVNTGNILVAAAGSVALTNTSLMLLVWDRVTLKWRILAGGGGGGTIANATFTGTSVVSTADNVQKFRYTGVTSQTLATFTFSSMPDGATLTVTGSSNTNTITIPSSLSNIQLNGPWVGYQYSVITFIKDSTQLIEVSRNAI